MVSTKPQDGGVERGDTGAPERRRTGPTEG